MDARKALVGNGVPTSRRGVGGNSVNQDSVPDRIIQRLRTNLQPSGIRLTEPDLAVMVERGFLDTVTAFEQLAERVPADSVPDYLKAWAPPVGSGAGQSTRQRPESEPVAQAGDPVLRPSDDDTGPMSIADAAGLIHRREVSPLELTERSLGRIAERDPVLNAFQLVLEEEALAGARQAEREIAAGTYRGPLHGVPVAVKDLLAMAGTPTTAGSKILAGNASGFDAAGVERLRDAGAVITGKTRLSEFAYSPGSNNAHYGPTRNPWSLEHDTGGSSSGSAAAVADGLVYGALGSDTGGSIRIPASLCGVVGLKPTYGRVSLYGAVTLSWSLDHLGPITHTVRDAALMLAALAGADARDPRTRHGSDYAGAGSLEAGVKGLRIGVLRDDGSGRTLGIPEALEAWRAGLAALQGEGAEVVEIDLPEMNELRTLNSAILGMEAAAYHGPTLRERLEDYGEFMRTRVLAAYAYGPHAFIQAQQARAGLRQRFDAVWARADLLSTPTMPYGAPSLGVPATTTFTAPFNVLGWPAVTVPVGLTADNLPLGLQLAGKPWDEETVLRAARVVEACGPWPGYSRRLRPSVAPDASE